MLSQDHPAFPGRVAEGNGHRKRGVKLKHRLFAVVQQSSIGQCHRHWPQPTDPHRVWLENSAMRGLARNRPWLRTVRPRRPHSAMGPADEAKVERIYLFGGYAVWWANPTTPNAAGVRKEPIMSLPPGGALPMRLLGRHCSLLHQGSGLGRCGSARTRRFGYGPKTPFRNVGLTDNQCSRSLHSGNIVVVFRVVEPNSGEPKVEALGVSQTDGDR